MVTRRKIDESKFYSQLRTDDNLSQSLPINSLFSGVNFEGKEIDSKSILLETPDMENFSRYSAIIRDYFFSIEKNHKSFALLLGKLLSDKRGENLKGFLSELEKMKNPTIEEVNSELNIALAGAPDDDTKALLSSLKELYRMNNSVYDRFKKQSALQNPVFDFITKYKKKLEAESNTKDVALEFGLESETLDTFDKLEEVLKSTLVDGKLKENDLTKIYFANRKKQGFLPENDNPYEIIKERYETVKKMNSINRLTKAHEDSSLSARVFMIKTFQSGKNKKNLGSLFYQRGMSPAEVEDNSNELQDYIYSSVTAIKLSSPTLARSFSSEVIKEITKEITQRYTEAVEERDRNVLNAIDDQSNSISSTTKISPDISMEEQFMKITEDTVYNIMMKNRSSTSNTLNVSGLDAYNNLVEAWNEEIEVGNENSDIKQDFIQRREEAIDIQSNLSKGYYAPPSKGGENHKLTLDALSLWNIRTVAKSIGDGTISKEEAKRGLADAIKSKSLKDIEKNVFIDEMIKKFDHKEALQSLELDKENLRDIDKKTGDVITNYNARRLYSQLYNDSGILKAISGKRRVVTKTALELQTCLESASSPKISSHSGSSEVSQCFDAFKKKLEEHIKDLEKVASQPAAALAGLSVLAILVAAWQTGTVHSTNNKLLAMEKERIQAIDFVNLAENATDKHFRSNILKNNKFYISDDIVEKKDLDEWIFRTALAKHEHTIYSDSSLKNLVTSIRNAPDTVISARTFREGFRDTLKDNGIKDKFNEFLVYKQDELKDKYDIHEEKFYEDMEKMGNAVSYASVSELEEYKNTFGDHLKNITTAYQSGAISLKVASEDFNRLSKSASAIFKAHSKKTKELLTEVETAKKNNKYLSENPSSSEILAKNEAEREHKRIMQKLSAFKTFSAVLSQSADEAKEFATNFSYQKELNLDQDIFSQKVAFGDDIEKSMQALENRYSNSKVSMDTVTQDLILLEEFQSFYKKDRLIHGDSGAKDFISKGFNNKQLQSITSMKALVREFYISHKMKDGKKRMSESEIMRELYEAKKEAFSQTADIDFTLVEQNDKTKTQVIVKEKASEYTPRDDISEELDYALDTLKQSNLNSLFEDSDLAEESQRALEKLNALVGLKISPSGSSTQSSRDGEQSKRAQYAINNDSTDSNYVQHSVPSGL